MTSRRCQGCGNWYETKQPACPECEAPAPVFNAGLAHARLNTNLNAQKAHAVAEGR